MPRNSSDTLIERAEQLVKTHKARLKDILPHVEHPEPGVRAAYLRALWECPSDAAFSSVTKAIDADPDPQVQAAAVFSLGRYIWSGMQMDELLDEEFGYAENVSEAQLAEARARLDAVFRDEARAVVVRHEALEALAWDPDEKTRHYIETLWKEGIPAEKQLALRCMGRSGLRQYHGLILAALTPPDTELLRSAIEAAGEGCLEATEDALLILTQHSEKEVALAAIWALRNVVHTQTGRKTLEKLARSKDKDVKAKAKAALDDLDAVDVVESKDEE